MSKINILAGWALVPAELPDDMLVAACQAGCWRVTAQSIKDVRAAYAAMLAAAPTPPVDAVLGEPVARDDYARIGLLEWAVTRWREDVQNRPMVNIYRAGMDKAWRSAIRHFGGDPDAIIGPNHSQIEASATVASRAVQAEPVAQAPAQAGGVAPTWGYAKTVGNAIAQLQTMDRTLPFYAALHLQDGRCIARGVTFSRERVVNERWIDNTNKDVPYSIVVWSQPVESLYATPPAQPVLAPVVREPLSDAQIIALHHPFDGAVTLARKIEKAHGINGELTVPDLTNSSRKALADHVLNIVYSYAEAALNCRYFEEKKGPLDQWRERDHDVYEARVRKIEAQNRLNYVVRDAIERAHGIQATTGEQSHG